MKSCFNLKSLGFETADLKQASEIKVPQEVFDVFVTHSLTGTSVLVKKVNFSKAREYFDKSLTLLHIGNEENKTFAEYKNQDTDLDIVKELIHSRKRFWYSQLKLLNFNSLLQKIRNCICHGNYLLKNGMLYLYGFSGKLTAIKRTTIDIFTRQDISFILCIDSLQELLSLKELLK